MSEPTDEVERLRDQLASLREHTLDSSPALRSLHEQAVLYRNAVEAYCEVHGPLSTTLEWVIRHGSLSGNGVLRLQGENEQLRARLEAIKAIVRDIDSECPPADPEWNRSQWWEAMDSVRSELRAALSVAPQLQPATCDRGICGRPSGHEGPHREQIADALPAEPTKCEHGETAAHVREIVFGTVRWCPGPISAAAPEATP